MTEPPRHRQARGRALRILHLRSSDRFGGPERLLVAQVVGRAQDVEPWIAAFAPPDASGAFLEAVRAAGARAVRIRQASSYDPVVFARTRALVRRLDPDVTVSHDYRANLVSQLALRGRPRIAVVHGYTGEDAKVRLFEAVDRRILRRMDGVVVPAPALAERLLQGGLEARRVHVVENGIDAQGVRAAAGASRETVRAEWGAERERPVVLALGRWSPEKGQDVLLEAFARTRHPTALLVLVGEGALRPWLERRAAADDLRGRVRLEGWRDDPHACLGAADLFVLPSRAEGLPLALLEALAVGVPVVATRVGAVADVLQDGAGGELVAAGDPAALSRAMAEVLADPAQARERAGRGALRVRAAYGVGRQVRRLEAIYRRAAGACEEVRP